MIKLVALISILVGVISAIPVKVISDAELLTQYKEYKEKYGELLFDYVPDAYRFKLYKSKILEINAHNELFCKGLVSYKKGENQFTGMTLTERSAMMMTSMQKLTEKPCELEDQEKMTSTNKNNDTNWTKTAPVNFGMPVAKALFKHDSLTGLNSSNLTISIFNWTAMGVVSSVKNQKYCSGSWAFAAASSIESAYAIKINSTAPDFSAQQLIDCDSDNFGCKNGSIEIALNYTITKGIELATNYSYVAGDCEMESDCKLNGKWQTCQYNPDHVVIKTKSFNQISMNATEIQQVIQVQPLTTYIKSTNDFQDYKSGVFDTSECESLNGDDDINHALLIVGYGIEKDLPYWLVKNSWDVTWGEMGYGKVLANVNMCNIEFKQFYPIL